MYLFTTSRHGVPAKELQRQLGVTYKTAWRIGHEIRKYMVIVDGGLADTLRLTKPTLVELITPEDDPPKSLTKLL